MQFDQLVLLGHSFGAYIAAHYALAHRDRIYKLILLSVPGVPQKLKNNEPAKDYGKLMKSNFKPPPLIGKLINYGFKNNLDIFKEHLLGPAKVYKMHMKRAKNEEDVAF